MNSVADLHSKILERAPSSDPNSFNSSSFWENLAKLYFGASWRVGIPTSGKFWIRQGYINLGRKRLNSNASGLFLHFSNSTYLDPLRSEVRHKPASVEGENFFSNLLKRNCTCSNKLSKQFLFSFCHINVHFTTFILR